MRFRNYVTIPLRCCSLSDMTESRHDSPGSVVGTTLQVEADEQLGHGRVHHAPHHEFARPRRGLPVDEFLQIPGHVFA